MDVHHAARAVGSDNDEPIVLIGFVDCVRGLADRRAQNRCAVLVTDEVGLLSGPPSSTHSNQLLMAKIARFLGLLAVESRQSPFIDICPCATDVQGCRRV